MIALCADLHIHPHNQFNRLNSKGRSTRLIHCLECFDWIIEESSKRVCSTLIIAGDLFDTRYKVSTEVLSEVSALIYKASLKMDVCLLVGNHELYGDYSLLDTFIGYDNVRVILSAQRIHIRDAIFDFIPFKESLKDVESELKYLSSYSRSYANQYLITHLSVDGGRPSGSEKHITQDRVPVSIIARNGYRRVFSGHYHHRQGLDAKGCVQAPKDAYFTYLGSPMQHDRGDYGAVRGITFLEPITGDIKFVENEFSPRFTKERWSSVKNAAVGYSDVKNTYCDLIIDTEEEPTEDEVKEFKWEYQIEALNVIREPKEIEALPVVQGIRTDSSKALEEYVGLKGKKKSYLKVGLELLERGKDAAKIN